MLLLLLKEALFDTLSNVVGNSAFIVGFLLDHK
jgi:hypothetical protein